MSNITIDRGESVSLGFEINGIVIDDLLHLQVYVGDWSFKLSNGTIEQDTGNDKLFYVRLNSEVTYRSIGIKPISLAVVTDLLGVNKESNIASLIVKETNQRTVLDDLANYIAGTFVVTIDLDQISTNVVIESIYRGAQGIQGEQVIQGEQGIQGIQGEQGIQGIPGEDAPDNVLLQYVGATYSLNEIQTLTEAEYTAIGTKIGTTLYITI